MIKRAFVIGIIIFIVLATTGTLIFSNKQKQEILLPDEGAEENEELIAQISESENITSQESIPAPQAPPVKEFSIAIDEGSINPNTITANKGDKVKITFTFNDANIYYGGLDVYDPEKKFINIKYRKADSDMMIVEFIAEKSFVYSGYWPNTGNKKASGKVEVAE